MERQIIEEKKKKTQTFDCGRDTLREETVTLEAAPADPAATSQSEQIYTACNEKV
jgi:hypothetical protein